MRRGEERLWTACLGLLLALPLAGCGGGPKLPPMAAVSGTVKLDGKSLPRGTVQFEPDGSKGCKGPPAVGMIGPDGHFKLTTAGADGAVVGWHRVIVQAQQDVDLNTTSYAPSLIPAAYNDATTSGLTFEVKAGVANVFDLPLKSQP